MFFSLLVCLWLIYYLQTVCSMTGAKCSSSSRRTFRAMSGAVSGLREVPEFQSLFLLFQNPLLGVLAGALLTAVIQSSSASVGILQALAVTGQVSYAAAIPIIMGQNIGTCVTAVISAVGTNKNAKRAALVHLSFNVIGSAVWLAVFWGVKIGLSPAFLE